MFPTASTEAIAHLPESWIGVRAGWQLLSENPWPHLISTTSNDLDTHGYLVGASGEGKTNLFHHCIAQDMGRGHSVCVICPRGDLATATVKFASRLKEPRNVKIFNLREQTRGFGLNPLAGAGEPYFRALSVLSALRSLSASWGVQIEETAMNALMLLAESGAHLTQIERLFFDSDFRMGLVSRCLAESVVNFWVRYQALSPERQATLAGPVMNKLSPLLATKTIRQILGHPTPIALREHIDRPGSVTIISLAVDEMHESGRMFGALFLSSLCREVFSRVTVAEKKRVPLRLYIDEFEHFESEDIESILVEGRKHGFTAMLAHQTLAQLSPRTRSIILGNVGLKAIFRCGRDDVATLSKDIFGSSNAYDFGELPRGYMMLWRRSVGVDEVEVNEPLIPGGETLNPSEELFLDEVYRYAGAIASHPIPSSKQSTPPEEPQAKHADRSAEGPTQTSARASRKGRTNRATSLEDWL